MLNPAILLAVSGTLLRESSSAVTTDSAYRDADVGSSLPNVLKENRFYSRADLLTAVRAGSLKAVQRYVAKQVELEVQDHLGMTPVNVAAERGGLGIVKCLVEAGASVVSPDHAGRTPLLTATAHGNAKVVEYLAAALTAMQEQEPGSKFLDLQDAHGWTALHIAANLARPDLVRILVEAGASVDVQDRAGQTPLHTAVDGKLTAQIAANHGVKYHGLGVVRYLVEEGHANLYTKDANGALPLRLAATNGTPEVRKYLEKKVSKDKADQVPGRRFFNREKRKAVKNVKNYAKRYARISERQSKAARKSKLADIGVPE